MVRTASEEVAHLRMDIDTLLNKINFSLPDVENSLTSTEPLPEGCPSRVSLALMALSDIEEKLGEFTETLRRLRESIRKQGQ